MPQPCESERLSVGVADRLETYGFRTFVALRFALPGIRASEVLSSP